MIDIDRVRADTAGIDRVAHFDNAGSSLPPRHVVDAHIEYLRAEELMGGYEAQDTLADRLAAFYSSTAELLGCATDEVAFTGGASDAWWRAFSSVPLIAGDRILAGRSEFQANAFGLLQARDRGVIVDVVPHDRNGEIDLDAFEGMLDDRVRLVCVIRSR
jgi:selenocysteine lyase/cysteine desulfurase